MANGRHLMGEITDGYRFLERAIVRVASGDLYAFYLSAGAARFYYRKSTDDGLTWSIPVQIAIITNAEAHYSVWYDRWTSGDSGNLIHIWVVNSSDDVVYYNLTVTTDTLSSVATVVALTSASSTAGHISGAKARGGNLYIAYDIDGGTELDFYRSTDGGVNWTDRATPWEGTADYIHLFPGNEADNQDMWAIFWDTSANEISLKTYDDSGDSWAETSISGSMVEALVTTGGISQFSGAIRHSDGHLIMAAWNGRDTGADDLMVWDINGAASITALTNVITNTDDCANAAVQIDQATNDIYVYYAGKSDGSQTLGSSVGVYYKASTDDGATWGAEAALEETLDDIRQLVCDHSGTPSGMGVMWGTSRGEHFVPFEIPVAGSGGGGHIIGGGM